MTQCPACHSHRVVFVLFPHHSAFCARCGARWVQMGRQQTEIVAGAVLVSDSTEERRE
jgi:hypothetical protein